MNDRRPELQGIFDGSKRFDTFDDMLLRIQVQGVRCHADTLIEVQSPITAFCGLNGTGKTSLLQMASMAYYPPWGHPFRMNQFFVITKLDPTPFKTDAKIAFTFAAANNQTRTQTISYQPASQRWRGYDTKRKRPVLLLGVSSYFPRVEQTSFKNSAPALNVKEAEEMQIRVRDWARRILGRTYAKLFDNQLTKSDRRGGRIASVEQGAISYSEAHMGFGEARTIHLVKSIEALRNKSLVLLEEPEISLHPSAQYEFGRYLVDVAIEKGHQILLTTHSEPLMEALSTKSRIYLDRSQDSVRPLSGMTASVARSLMSEGKTKALTVLVEDACAKDVLTEIIRLQDPHFLRTIHIHAGKNDAGIDKDKLMTIMTSIQSSGIRAVGVRDADFNGNHKAGVFKLPGALPPEKEIISCKAVAAYLMNEFACDLEKLKVTELNFVDHHEWIERIAAHVSTSTSALSSQLARVYVATIPPQEISTLIELLKDAAGQK